METFLFLEVAVSWLWSTDLCVWIPFGLLSDTHVICQVFGLSVAA